ncbi:MAG: hypothetical protein ACR2RF_14365 [Geminicoccaceae bacterium]
MAKYRKKPVVIEAVQWLGPDHMGSRGLGVMPYQKNRIDDPITPCKHCSAVMSRHGWVPTLEGGHIACPKDWIITGVKGEKYPCKPDVFEATYDREPTADEPITGHWRGQGL